MKQACIAILAILALGCTTLTPFRLFHQPQEVRPAEDIVLDSVVRLTVQTSADGTWICTAFSVAPRKFLTAAHCTLPLNDDPFNVLKLNGVRAFVIAEDEYADLAVVLADILKPVLSVRDKPLVWKESVSAAGFGHALTSPLLTHHTVALLDYKLLPEYAVGTIFMNPFIGGMSGGPIFDATAQVVGVVQRGSNFIGYGVSSVTILDFLKKAPHATRQTPRTDYMDGCQRPDSLCELVQ